MPCASSAAIAAQASLPPKGVWVIYDEPRSGCPCRYVARKFYCGAVFTFSTDEEYVAATLGEARALLPEGLVNVGRHEQDPTGVVEVWC